MEERRHRCRVCSKSFSTGRSLGGHMRSHVVMNPMEVGVEEGEEEKKMRSSVGVVNGYGLRDNPRKTKRFTISLKKRFEKECGESWKSLLGDMRCVNDDVDDAEAEDEEGAEQEEEEEEEEGSWSVLSDNEVTGLAAPAKKRRSRRMSMEAQASSSSALEQEEQEDVALALMMLSRDTGHWNVAESSDKNSVVDEEQQQQQQQQQQLLVSDHGFGFKKQKMIASDDTDSFEQCDSRKRSKYECSTCKKSFQSYQALGGHRAAHKRHPGGCLGLRIDENRIENTNSDAASVDVSDTKKGKNHECLICGKGFSSGQALGGHKRSHLASSSINGGGDPNAVIPNLIDLNLPAPVDGESKFKNWWKCDAVVSMISN